jgi:[histone H3]-lysine36 N-dimethyltransferase SETMAR
MEGKTEQRYAVKFCFKLGKTQTETIEMLSTAYGQSAMKRTSVKKWYNRFKSGEETVLSQERSGRPSTSVTEDNKSKVDELVRKNRRITVNDMVNEVGISVGSIVSILSELGYRKVCARWVPHLLTEEQRQTRISICQQWRSQMRRQGANNFLKRVVTCDETWVHHYDPESKQESCVWKHKSSPRPQKAKVCRSAGKVMHLVFFDYQGIIYDHCIPRGQTVTGNYYSTVLKDKLMPKMKKKRPDLVDNGWLLHHDNAPAHRSRVCQEILDEIGVELLVHPPYSPDLAPCDFFLFPELKKYLRGNRYQSDGEVNNAVSGALKVISKDGLWKVFEAWQDRWIRCIEAEGNYFEGH